MGLPSPPASRVSKIHVFLVNIYFTFFSKGFDTVTVLTQPVAYNRPIMKANITVISDTSYKRDCSILQPRVGPLQLG